MGHFESRAREHVIKGRRIVARQRELIAEARARGATGEKEQELLVLFEKSLALFEADLRAIVGDAGPGHEAASDSNFGPRASDGSAVR